jgi:hypothetical protein
MRLGENFVNVNRIGNDEVQARRSCAGFLRMLDLLVSSVTVVSNL